MEIKKVNELLSVILIIFIYPFGIPYMWITRSFTLRTSWIVTVSFLLAIFLGFALIIVWTSAPGYRY